MTQSMKKTPTEVLMYLQNVRKYFETNEAAKDYFSLKEENKERFFNYITELSERNFEDNGEPELSLDQFEELRRKISGDISEKKEILGIFFSLGVFGRVSLN